MTLILLGVVITSYIALSIAYKPLATYSNGMLFAITLPAHAMEDKSIQKIQDRFNKQFTKVKLWLIVLLIPFVLLHYLSAYHVIYFFGWLITFFIVSIMPFRRAFRDTLALKSENDWFVGKKRMIQSDLRVAYLKNQRSASLWLFTIPFAIAMGLMLWVARDNDELIIVTSGGLALTFVFLLVSLLMRRVKAKVYSTNSDVNVSLNQAFRRSTSFLWLNLAIIENIHYLLIYLLINNDNMNMTGIWIAITLLFSALPIGIILYVYRKIKDLEQEVLAQDGKAIYTDDDECWASGIFYHNPLDKSIFVEKRIGIGFTMNTATLVGKIIGWGSLGLVAVLILGVSFMLIRSELTSPILTIAANQKIEIEYPMHSFDFNLADIEQLSLVEQIPTGSKTYGEATGKSARGSFNLKELGKSRLYIFKNNPPYIQIKLKNVYIFYNKKDPLQTKQLFEQLQNNWRVK